MRILITGASGLIGRSLVDLFSASGHEIVLVDRLLVGPTGGQPSVAVDLLDSGAILNKLAPYLPADVVIHLAALAHGQVPPEGYDTISFNVGVTRNLLSIIHPFNPHLIFASSVAVYGEVDRGRFIYASEEPLPATEYGQSKLECEHILKESSLTDIEILRLTPIFSNERLKDISKRVFSPGAPNLRMRISPEPFYSFCHLKNAGEKIKNLINKGRQGRNVRNVCDQDPYGQHQISNWFKGLCIPIPAGLFFPFSVISGGRPGTMRYRVFCDIHKLFFTHLYDENPVPF